MSIDFTRLSAQKAAQHIRTGKVDARELLEFHLEAIRKNNSKVNALCHVSEKTSRDMINKLHEETKAGKFRGRLHGLAYSAKDVIPVSGMPRSDGNPQTVESSSKTNSALIEKLSAEGAVCIGKANMAEYGKSYYTDNPVYGRTNNPFDITRSPGGSGGGDSAALALDFCQFGVGADSGGSIRVPGNFCGQFALYPTHGLFSNAGMPHLEHTIYTLFRCPGVLSKTIDDLEILFSILKGFDPIDENSVPDLIFTQTSSEKKRYAFFNTLNGVKADNEICSSLNECIKTLEAKGYTGKEIAPSACAGAYEIFIILAGQAALAAEDMIATMSANPRDLSKEGKILKNLRKRLGTELPPLSAETVLKAWWRVASLRKEIHTFFSDYDFIICPVSATQPPLHETSDYKVNGQSFQSQQVFQFASCVNVLGLPAVSFPTKLSSTKLPLGLQIIGPRFSERYLMSIVRMTGFSNRLIPSN